MTSLFSFSLKNAFSTTFLLEECAVYRYSQGKTVFWLNSVQEKLLGCFWSFSYVYTIKDTKLPYQKPMLRQINRMVSTNGPITKNGVLPVTTLFFSKICFTLRALYKELILFSNYSNVHICTFCKRWSFIWQCFFNVGILKLENYPYFSDFFFAVNRIGSKALSVMLWISQIFEIKSIT